MALTKDETSFGLYRLILQQAMGAGYRTQSIRQNQNYLRNILDLFCPPGEAPLIRQDETERSRYLFRPDETHWDSNYLFRLYSLCPPGNKNTDFVSAQIMQVLAEAERAGGQALRTNAILEKLQNRWVDIKKEDTGWTTKLQPRMDRLLQRGVLQKCPKGYRLMPELPEAFLSGENLVQLHRLCALIPMLSDRCMPESWGYRTKETLLGILEVRGLAEAPPKNPSKFLKADSRPQLILDDAILWDILTAHAMGLWIQLDYRFPSTGHIVSSCKLQSLKVWTNAGEGRSYLIARESAPENEPEARPVVLPLDMIAAVHLLDDRNGLFGREEQEAYLDRWFCDSFSGISPAECDCAGKPCLPVRVQISVTKPKGMSTLRWERHRPRGLGQGITQPNGSIVYSLQVTRPEDLEPTLIRYDDIIRDVETEGHPFASIWRKRRKLWHQVGIQSPYAPVEILLPSSQETLEPQWKGLQTPLLHPDMIPRIQNEIRKFNRELRTKMDNQNSKGTVHDSRDEKQQPKGETPPNDFLRYDENAPIPVRLNWAELDWLERFLRDPLVAVMLEPGFCDELAGWACEALELAVSSGYVRRNCGDFLHLNRRIGRTTDKVSPAAQHMVPVVDALYSRRQLRISYETGKNRKHESKGDPLCLEYYQGTGNLLLQLRNMETGMVDKIRCTRIISVDTIEGSATLEPELVTPLKRSVQLLLPGNPEFRVRAIGLLQPYLDSVFEDPYGSMRINLIYPEREEDLLARFLRLLVPGVLLTEGAPQSLCEKYRAMFPKVKCAFPPRYRPAGKAPSRGDD